jgi:hypothetical protein
MNLWILDEKLAYHHYLASDIPLSEMKEVIEIDSSDRPDVLIFHGTSAFADSAPPFSSLTLIEFKRPARRYVREIKAAKATDRRGRPITVPDRIPIYAYIICDTGKKQASDGWGGLSSFLRLNPRAVFILSVKMTLWGSLLAPNSGPQSTKGLAASPSKSQSPAQPNKSFRSKPIK